MGTCFSAAYMSRLEQQRFTISEVAADWQELMIPWRIMRPIELEFRPIQRARVAWVTFRSSYVVVKSHIYLASADSGVSFSQLTASLSVR